MRCSVLSDIRACRTKHGDLITKGFWLVETTKEWKMRQPDKGPEENIVKDVKWAIRNQFFSE